MDRKVLKRKHECRGHVFKKRKGFNGTPLWSSTGTPVGEDEIEVIEKSTHGIQTKEDQERKYSKRNRGINLKHNLSMIERLKEVRRVRNRNVAASHSSVNVENNEGGGKNKTS